MLDLLYGNLQSVWEIVVYQAVAGDFYDGVFLCSFFTRDVVDEMWDLTESVYEVFPTYSSYIHWIPYCTNSHKRHDLFLYLAHA